jgi:hypothetical protein
VVALPEGRIDQGKRIRGMGQKFHPLGSLFHGQCHLDIYNMLKQLEYSTLELLRRR